MRDGTAGAIAVESVLADGIPFGSHAFIAGEVASVYTGLLGLVAEESAGAKHLLTRLDEMPGLRTGLFRDPLVRRTVEDGVCLVAEGMDTIDPVMLDDLLTAAALALDGAGERTLLDADGRGALLGPTAEFGHVWAGDERGTLPGRRFVDEIHKRVPQFRVLAASRPQVEVLTRGARLACEIAPDLATSALRHVFMVVLGEFDAEGHTFNSFTLPGLPGVLILSPDVLADDAVAAEALVHEAFHLKFLDIDYIRPLFAPGFRQETSPRTTPAWHEDEPGAGGWPVDRVLTSMHVYLALSVFLDAAASAGGVDRWADAATRADRCRSRSAWLLDAVQPHLGCLTGSGRQFVESIGSMQVESAGLTSRTTT
ncbi:hypothetical protein GCM10009836_33160 [Pseudonocardia ailaonensis]|uniref:HEXXH motif domain-containing protein n=1 Tax=Pseudonocardia ailaonensis TaxID=367279 RepID=A0ABN2N4C3_9PSEU